MVRFYIVVFSSLFLSFSIAQMPDLQFEHITVEDGLLNNCVTCILQDLSGFMWFGTSDGLNRFDGYTFKSFIHDAADTNTISGNHIYALFEDTTGFLWIATNNGLNIFDPITEKISICQTVTEDSNSISNNVVNTIFKDYENNIWIGTENGLNRFNRQNANFNRYYFPGQLDSVSFWWNNNTIRAINQDKLGRLLLGTTNDFIIFDTHTGMKTIIPYMIPGRKRWPSVTSIYRDNRDKFWIGIADDGLVEYDPETGNTSLYQTEPNNQYSFNSEFSNTIYEDRNNQLWIGTADKGINIFNRISKKFTRIKIDNQDEHGFKGQYICCIYEDKQGNIWIGTLESGINLLPRWQKPFRHYLHDPKNPNSLISGEITGFYEDPGGVLWISHFLGGISMLNRNTGTVTHMTHDEQNPATLSGGGLFGFCADGPNHIWLASTPFLDRLDRKTGIFKHFKYNMHDSKSHAYTFTLCCYKDRQGIMWFGTSNAGLERFNHADETFDRFCHNPDDSSTISSNVIYDIYQDKSGRLWIGTGSGLCQMLFDKARRERFIRYFPDPSNPASISGQEVYSIFEDRIGRLWFGTDGGLNQYDYEKKIFHAITIRNGLPSNMVFSVLEDDQGISAGKAGNLWLRTLRGIVRYNPERGDLRVYDEGDGLRHGKAIQNGYAAFHKGENGEIYTGSDKSMAVFHPDSLKENPDIPPIVLTDLKINYESVKTGPNSPLKRSLSATGIISLAYFQNTLSFEFAALDYTSPGKNLYAYKLEGINADWIYTDATRRFTTYTNLDPGEYIFRVKGSNNDGLWNEQGNSMRIIISPPWWKTNWAYGSYFMLLMFLIYTTWRVQLNRLKMKHQMEMEHLHAEKLEEVDRMKSRFFANISHEFRTPLTLILGPISSMISRTRRQDVRENLDMMKRNALRLQRLINQLLDLSKIEAGKMRLEIKETELISFINRIVQSFESRAKLKNIQLTFSGEAETIPGYIDPEKLENILYNLLSNAFNFTPRSGKITVQASSEPLANISAHNGMFILISVSDSGIGIPADKIPYIFDRFYQIDDSYPREQPGSGIGLALTKELVDFHRGQISVSSQTGKGTTFTIRLPIYKSAYRDNEIVSISGDSAEAGRNHIEQEDIFETESLIPPTLKRSTKKSLPIILVVEDNPDMRTYIRHNLENEYRIIDSEDGVDGFQRCIKVIADLVISDVMMPKMDGFALCAKLKKDERTSHIPVILLTARAAAEDKIGGLESGADDYLIKPFNARELQVRVKNLIEQRRTLRERFRNEAILHPRQIGITSTDQRFFQKASEIIENHLSDPAFDTRTFSREIGMSRMQLHRKLTALTNMAPKEFIRALRLQRAAQLLRQKFGNITEVAYEVGFSNPSYFTECFRKNFGMTPIKYYNKHAPKM